jgi:homoserine O-succinyltransferase
MKRHRTFACGSADRDSSRELKGDPMPDVVEVDRMDSNSALRSLNVAFVNNLPDAALGKAERQFTRLLTKAAGGPLGRWQRYRCAPAASDAARNRSASPHYGDMNELRRARPDIVIVTGAEPTTTELADEPFWWPLADLLDWAEASRTPVLLSCLAAHAAVLHFDGIRRTPLEQKRFGVFEHEVVSGHEVADGPVRQGFVPHSRWNEVSETVLTSNGYQVLTRSCAAGVDMFVRTGNRSFLFCQGHPEYEPETLLGEYRRDVLRYLRRDREAYPELPIGCFDAAGIELAMAFRRHAEARRDERLGRIFPYDFLAEGLDRSWYLAMADMITCWLHQTGASLPGLTR